MWSKVEKLSRQQLKHLLWTYYFLKTYDTKEQVATRFGTNPKKLQKWAWAVADKIAKLPDSVVSAAMEMRKRARL